MIKKKMSACIDLAKIKAKFIPNKEMRDTARKYGLSREVLVKAWQNFKASGGKIVDRRTKSGKGSLRLTPSEPVKYFKKKELSLSDACKIVRDFMDAHDMTVHQFCNLNEINPNQLYEMIRELDIHGTLLGKKILSAKECGSVDLIDTIHLYRKPKTQRKSIKNMTEGELALNKRIATLLYKHLNSNIT